MVKSVIISRTSFNTTMMYQEKLAVTWSLIGDDKESLVRQTNKPYEREQS